MNKTISVPTQLVSLATLAKELGKEVFAVGGYVRNALLQIEFGDLDIAGNCSAEQMQTLCKKLGYQCTPINAKLGTLLIKDKSVEMEYTAYRTEKYPTGGQHSPESVEFVSDYQTDALRRDFTINALYYDPITQEVFDPVNGLKDLNTHTLCCIASPKAVFQSDGLRILRFIRFACELNFSFDKASLLVAKQQIHLLNDISKVRMLKELKAILTSDTKYRQGGKSLSQVVALFNQFQLYPYLFHSGFKKMQLVRYGKLYHAFLLTPNANRFYAFMVLVLYHYFKKQPTSVANLTFTVNSILGNEGLQESNENMQKIVHFYNLFQTFWFEPEISNALCIQVHSLADVAQQFLAHCNAKKAQRMMQQIDILKNKQVPFCVGDLKVTSAQLISAGIADKNLSKIKVILFNECLNENLMNENKPLLNYARLLQNKLK